jgi:hypothetical protein
MNKRNNNRSLNNIGNKHSDIVDRTVKFMCKYHKCKGLYTSNFHGGIILI